MGPCGGGGGKPWKMDMRGVNRIIKVVVRHGAAVDAMSVLYERDGQKEKTKLWGGSGGKRSEICLEPGEHLTNIRGHYGFFNGWFVIRSLTFVSNRRTFGPYPNNPRCTASATLSLTTFVDGPEPNTKIGFSVRPDETSQWDRAQLE
ncbi:unnamed protein product [Triticum turgidum subsp. durum]|uniref:Jacalin-type lectin domain-containing protein n=1 Tax=Triticum turgidum subsp. durum TaxID=4567 RepID=A0A9R0XVN3_TRITD|nr:unnamed protein product [Triticum turgidum subsp. durum]